MTAALWMASPPEVHSTLLSNGPGPESLLSAATAWSSLSAEYDAVAVELMAVLGAVQTGVWQGLSAELYMAAHAPYLAWLKWVSVTSAATAAKHETAAADYSAALAAMPTSFELATNHLTHGALVATNFLGSNTLPITLNEADYARMWIQAATVMATYQATAGMAVASVPSTGPAPQVVKSSAAADHDGHDHDHDHGHCHGHGGDPSPVDNAIAEILRILSGGRVNWDPAEGTVNEILYDDYTNAGQPIWWVVRALELSQDFRTLARSLFTNPVAAFQLLVYLALFDWPTHIGQIAQWLSESPQLLGVAISGAISNLGAVTGFAGLSGLAALHPAVISVVAPPAAAALMMPPAAGLAPTLAASVAVPAAPSASVPAPSTVAGTGTAPPPPAGAAGGFGYPFLVGGGPGIGYGSGISAGVSASAKKKAPEPDSAAAVAAATAREQERRRRRRRRQAVLGEYGDELIDMDVEVNPAWGDPPGEEPIVSTVASDQGARKLGFAGTARKEAVGEAAGLTILADDEFGGGPKMPMVPGTWDSGRDVSC